ncbi:MAG: hypothetical protein M3077_01075 [Candidatus Dormibacteraeota bacterium]|nr:hypothetical protein [Candidatus Dormibacteraeota bacterium]
MSLARVLANEEEDDRRHDRGARPAGTPIALWSWLSLGLLLVALTPRLIYLFGISNPENAGDGLYTDAYQHWQIAYLTKEIGLSHGLRFWDLKGVEYFWGSLHPIVLVILFYVTGSTDIVLARLQSLTFGSLGVVLIFHLCRRYWNLSVALAATAFAAFAPTSVFNDASGMLEPMAVSLSLLGIWLLPDRSLKAGIVWALATAARPEAWLSSPALIVASCLRPGTVRRWLPLLFGFGGVMAAQMAFFNARTGNPIYPFYWNFLANAGGKWMKPMIASQQSARPWFVALWLIATAGLLWTLWRRPRAYLLLLYGFGSCALVLGLFGLTAFITEWYPWRWMMWILAFPYDFAALLVAVGLFVIMPRYLGRGGRPIAWLLAAALLLGTQLTWIPIQRAYATTESVWTTDVAAGRYIAGIFDQPAYRSGALNLPPPDDPAVTYALVRYGGLDGRHFISQLYDPIYYLPAGYHYVDHPVTVGVLLQCWLSSTNTSILVLPANRAEYAAYTAAHPDWFEMVGRVADYGWTIEAVHVPKPSLQTCDQAAMNARKGGP